MKKKAILIITQTVDMNDSALGFFCEWIREFSKQTEHVYVIANKVGEYDLPDTVTVVSLGKERGSSRFVRILLFWKYLVSFLPCVDGTLVHMCPEYVVYGGWLSRVLDKPLGLWYLHKSTSWRLTVAVKLVNLFFTAHEDGVALKTPKMVVTGHGIDCGMFDIPRKHDPNMYTVLTVGRVSPSKGLRTIIDSVILFARESGRHTRLLIVGEPYLESDRTYKEDLLAYITEQDATGMIVFVGKVVHSNLPKYLAGANVFVNASETGGVDKAILEAMAAGVPVISSNSAFTHILPIQSRFEPGNVKELTHKLMQADTIDVDAQRDVVEKNHNLYNTVVVIAEQLLW